MKKPLAATLAALLLCTPSALAASAPSDWAANDIGVAISQGIVPNALQGDWQRPITRAEFCTLAAKLLETRNYTFAPVPEISPFTDTEEEAVLKMHALGVVSGKEEGIFAPNDSLSREEAATMLFRLTESRALPTSYADQRTAYAFADAEQIETWAETAINFCYGTGVMSGTGEDRFSPDDIYTIEQAALTMLRLAAYAQAEDPTPLTFTAEGYPMLYSNNPENLDPRKFEQAGIYTAATIMPKGTPIDAEYYHWSYMGAEQKMLFGVSVTNPNRTTATISIDKRGVGIGDSSVPVSEACYTSFFASKGQDPVTVAPGQSRLILSDNVHGGQMINARVQLTADSENLTMKLVALKQEIREEWLEKLPRGIDDSAGRTAGLFNFSERRTIIDADQIKNFTLCGNLRSQWSLNPGEYPQSREHSDPLAVRDTGTAPFSYFLNGNFATIYHLDFENPAGKTLSIRPNDPSVKDTGGRYMLHTKKNGWRTIDASVDKPFEIALEEDMDMQFLLLGGNYGNIGFRIV